MYPCPHGVTEGRVYCLMAFNQSLAVKRIAHDYRLEMVTAAGGIPNFDVGIWQSEFDEPFDLLWVHRPSY